ncbi:MAG: hypothetical protein WC824_04420 [Bacteroidota bacterium]|jgi:hypothetical protein
MKRLPFLLLIFVSLADVPALPAQTPQELTVAKEALMQEVIAFMDSRVFPIMKQWKSQLESRLSARERIVLDGMRERYDMIRDNLNNNLQARQLAWEKRDYASFTSMRTLLRNNFEDRQKLFNEVARFTERNEKPFQYLSSRIDSTVEEWRGSSMRLFVDWFTKYRQLISHSMNTPARDDLARMMAACKNIRLEQLDDLAKVTFLLWDGEDYLESMRQNGLPESPLTDCGPKRDEILFVEGASPNPFSSGTTIRFFIVNPGLTRVRIVDAAGKSIQTLLNEELPVGKHQTAFRPSEKLSDGTFFVLVETGSAFDAIPIRYSRSFNR